MKIVQSFWTKPQSASPDAAESRLSGGWLDKKYHYMSWALSCLQLRKHYPGHTIELVTDKAGEELLLKKFELPYSYAVMTLNDLDHYDPNLWALGKLHAYTLQDVPFLHVDGDVFIWNRFSTELLESPIIVQHLEYGYDFYKRLLYEVEQNLPYIPEAIRGYLQLRVGMHAFNMGIAGGNDLEFFKLYTDEALRFVNNNQEGLKNIDVGLFNTVYEQVLFYCMLHQHRKKVGLLTETIGEERVNEELKGLTNFINAPSGTGYIHLYGSDCKKNIHYCRELERKLKEAYPTYYTRIMDFAVVNM